MHGKGICMQSPIKEWNMGSIFQIKIQIRPGIYWITGKEYFRRERPGKKMWGW
jgi:hypothetical protein